MDILKPFSFERIWCKNSECILHIISLSIVWYIVDVYYCRRHVRSQFFFLKWNIWEAEDPFCTPFNLIDVLQKPLRYLRDLICDFFPVRLSLRHHCGQQIYSLLQAKGAFPFIRDATVSQHGRNSIWAEGVLFVLGLFTHNTPVDFGLMSFLCIYIHVMFLFTASLGVVCGFIQIFLGAIAVCAYV